MKNLIKLCAVICLCGCAGMQPSSPVVKAAKPAAIVPMDAIAPDGANLQEIVKKNGFVKPINAAKWCFNALISGNGEGFYDRCSLKGNSALAELRKSRWERMANEAALKIDDKGGIISINIDCKHNESKDRAVCKINYQLAKLPNPLNTLMPLQFEADSGWLIVR